MIYNLEPDEFIKLINKLLIKKFELFLTEKDITANKILSDDFETREQKAVNLDEFINDIITNMPDNLIDKTWITYKADLNEFWEYRLNKSVDLLNENFKLLEQKEIYFNIAIGFLDQMNDLSTIQIFILYSKDVIEENEQLKSSLSLAFSQIDVYIDLFTKPEYKNHIKAILNDDILQLIEQKIKNHRHFLETYPLYKELYEKNKGLLGS